MLEILLEVLSSLVLMMATVGFGVNVHLLCCKKSRRAAAPRPPQQPSSGAASSASPAQPAAEEPRKSTTAPPDSASKSNGSGTDSSENGGNGGGNGGARTGARASGRDLRARRISPATAATWGRSGRGKCRWFNVTKGFGFIDPHFEEAKQHNDDVFVHQSALQMEGFRSLDENEEVEFVVHLGRNGLEAAEVQGADGAKLRGHHVRPLGKKREKMIRCFKCGQLGFHQASRCKKEIPAKACYHCHASDHLVSECPTYLAQKKEREEGKAATRQEGRVVPAVHLLNPTDL
ncbi:Protein lin-28-like protein isoform X1 [Aphelenchoides fujianensis]|nr:Protein lin-28-like protein isoform X1 [Aphelenchoides fujianensis]